ncbi:MAG: DoxX family protein [SAR324 cluster bacterium]|nr:DoxX family protein [SAR324 cluster bacterium]
MNIALWLLQIVLAGLFLMAGGIKAFTPFAELGGQMAWVLDVPSWVVYLAAWAEILGAIGLVLPSATRILPWLTPLAAAGLALDMLLATVFNFLRGDYGPTGFTIVLLAVSAFVAWSRYRLLPIISRNT